jgi:site-specific DNA-adenine methylase
MKITNLTSNKGNTIANQFEIRSENAVYFQSYQSIIVKIQDGITYLDPVYWNYSKTTSKYRNQFLGEDTKETEKKIKEGIYILTNLN